MANIPEISLPAEPVLNIGELTITNSNLAAILVTALLVIFGILIGKKVKLIPNRIQSIFEMLISYFLKQLTIAYGTEERAKKYLPFILSLFLFIFISNQFAIFPILGNLILNGETPLFRTPTSHFSLPIILALMTIVGCNVVAFSMSPLRYIGKFIKIGPLLKVRSLSDFGFALIEFFTGILDIIGEFAKIISLSARLFGNILSGELMYVIISGLSLYTQFIVPVPFLVLSVLSGVIQAFVFSFLALNFIASTIPAPQKQTA